MTEKQARVRIEKLRKEINHHRHLYHVEDTQEVSDAALDSLKHELSELEIQFPKFITPDSPTQRVGGAPLDKFEKVTHASRMLSLNDVFNEKEITDWEKRIKKLTIKPLEYYAEYKIDGLALSVIYEKGKLIQAATRGDGRVGENVTKNAKTIEALPLTLRDYSKKYPEAPNRIEIRGEVYMSKDAFEKLNAQQKKDKKEPFANPRNASAGAVRQLDSKISASRKLSFIGYDVVTDIGVSTHKQEHEFLEFIGILSGVKNNKVVKNISEVVAFHAHTLTQREKLPYWVDGVVVGVNNIQTYKKLGVVGKAPRAAIAFKYPAEQATTIVEDIQVQVGRTGALTPVAHLRSVEVAGSIVSRATLHNIDEIERLDVRVGDTVIIQKAGDIIPDIVEVLVNMRTGKEKKFSMPIKCPICSSDVIRKDGEVAHYCINDDCYAQQHSAMTHFISKKAFDIEGLGPKVLDQLFKADLIKTPVDIFFLKESDLQPLERFADKSAENLIEAIQNSKKITLARFIYALGIRHVGEETAIALANEFNVIVDISKASLERLERLDDIGGVVAKSIKDYFQSKKNSEIVNELLKKVKVINNRHNIPEALNPEIRNKKILVTGVLKNMSREQAKEQIRRAGGKWVSSVSKNTDFVVAGENPGSKVEKAKKFGVEVIDESGFEALFKSK